MSAKTEGGVKGRNSVLAQILIKGVVGVTPTAGFEPKPEGLRVGVRQGQPRSRQSGLGDRQPPI